MEIIYVIDTFLAKGKAKFENLKTDSGVLFSDTTIIAINDGISIYLNKGIYTDFPITLVQEIIKLKQRVIELPETELLKLAQFDF